MIGAHGSYPFDTNTPKWRHIRNLKNDEAVAMLPKGFGLVNKGYFVIGMPRSTALPGLSIAQNEEEGCEGALTPKPGMQAVYNQDGEFSLIERIARIVH